MVRPGKHENKQYESFYENASDAHKHVNISYVLASFWQLTPFFHASPRESLMGAKNICHNFYCISSQLKFCPVWRPTRFSNKIFDKWKTCVVISKPGVCMFLKWLYKIVLGRSSQRWNRTFAKKVCFIIFGAVIVSLVLETIVCFQYNLRWK